MTDIVFRHAVIDDLPAIVALLADDMLSRDREDASLPLDKRYVDAFEAVSANTNQALIVAVFEDEVVGTLQLALLPGLSKMGSTRGIIEAVRVRSDLRGMGMGTRLVAWAVEACRLNGCSTVRLTTDRRREDAHRFYERLGFKATHLGFKLDL